MCQSHDFSAVQQHDVLLEMGCRHMRLCALQEENVNLKAEVADLKDQVNHLLAELRKAEDRCDEVRPPLLA